MAVVERDPFRSIEVSQCLPCRTRFHIQYLDLIVSEKSQENPAIPFIDRCPGVLERENPFELCFKPKRQRENGLSYLIPSLLGSRGISGRSRDGKRHGNRRNDTLEKIKNKTDPRTASKANQVSFPDLLQVGDAIEP